MSYLENKYLSQINELKETLLQIENISNKRFNYQKENSLRSHLICSIQYLTNAPSDEKHIVSELFFKNNLSSLFYQETTKLIDVANNEIIINSKGNIVEDLYEEIQLIKSNPTLKSIDQMINFIWIMFYYSIYEDKKLYDLICRLYQSKFISIKSKATKLISQIVEKQKSILEEFENLSLKDNFQTFESLNNKIFFEFCTSIQSIESQSYQDQSKEREVYNYLKIKIARSDGLFTLLKFYVKNSIENKNISNELFQKLLEKSIKLQDFSIVVELFDILTFILKYDDLNKYWNKINFEDLIIKSNDVVLKSLKKISNQEAIRGNDLNLRRWKIATNFQKFVISLFEKHAKLMTKEKQIDFSFNENSFEKFENEKELSTANLNEQFDKYLSIRQNGEYLGILNKNKTVISISIENELLKNSNNELQKDYDNLHKDLNDKESKLKALENERLNLSEEIKNLRSLNSSKNKNVKHKKKKNNNQINDECTTKKNAKEFIDDLNSQNKNCDKFNHCEYLDHNLYENTNHFFLEIFQNFEDSLHGVKDSFFKCILDKEFILFCSNEKGFTKNDVKALSSFSESSKEKGIQVGHKGIGFKSVFACTDKPTIKSNNFQFSFKYCGNVSDYVTPYYVEDYEIEMNLKYKLEENKDASTFVYLPLKESYKENGNLNKFPIDSFYLLFTKNIQKIIVENNLKNMITNMRCEKEMKKSINSEKFKDFNLHECSLIEENSFNGEITTEIIQFYLYECKIEIPDDLIKEVKLKTNEIKLSIAFPFKNNLKKKFPVFSLLPVFDLGFKFILNTYWNLDTSRERVSTHSNYNRFLRNTFVEFFCLITKIDIHIRNNIKSYLLISNHMLNDWWALFVDDIRTQLKPVLENDILQNDDQDECVDQIIRVYDEKFEALINEEILALIGIKLIKDSDYLELGLEKLTLKDLLLCFKSEINCEKLLKWRSNVSSEYLEEFFRLLLNEYEKSIITLSDLENCDLFLIQNSQNCTTRTSIKISSMGNYYINIDNCLNYWWNDALKLVNYESNKEKNFLSKILNSRICNKLLIIETILVNQNDENIALNAKFLKENYKCLNDIRLDSFKLPIVGFSSLPISVCAMKSLFGINLSDFCINLNQKFIDYSALRITNSIKEILEYEEFFIDLNCNLPEIDLTKWENLINDIQNNENIFNNFTLLDKNDAKLAFQIIDKLNGTQILKLFKTIPIKSFYNAESKYLPIKSVFIKKIFKCYLPCIDPPDYAVDFYSKLGVTNSFDFDSCVKVLEQLASTQTTDEKLYLEWLNNLRKFANNTIVIGYPIVYLQNLTNDQFGFYSGDQIYCIENNDCIFNICKYSQKTIISSRTNNQYCRFESVFLALGAHNTIEIDDILDAITNVFNQDLFFEKINNFQRILRSDVYNDVRDLFIYLENKLVDKLSYNKKPITLAERKELLNDSRIKNLFTNKQKRMLKLITQEHEMLDYFDEYDFELFSCHDTLISIHDEFIKQYNKNIKFIDHSIAIHCPLVVSIFSPSYLDSCLNIQFKCFSTMSTNENLTQFAKVILNLEEIEIVKVENFKLIWTFKNEDRRENELKN